MVPPKAGKSETVKSPLIPALSREGAKGQKYSITSNLRLLWFAILTLLNLRKIYRGYAKLFSEVVIGYPGQDKRANRDMSRCQDSHIYTSFIIKSHLTLNTNVLT